MKMKRILAFILAVLALLAFVSCDNDDIPANDSTPSSETPNSTNNGTMDSQGSTSNNTGISTPDSAPTSGEEKPNENKPSGSNPSTPGADGDEFTVQLVYNGEVFGSTEENQIVATWNDGVSFPTTANVDEKGKAVVTGLNGEYDITLTGIPDGYTYNPNIYSASNDYKNVTIEIYKLGKTTGTGTGPYSCKVIKSTGVYSVTLKKPTQQVYFEFAPISSGTYNIESWVAVSDNKINPKVDIYNANKNFKGEKPQMTLNDGGAEGTYTKNFKYDPKLADEQITSGGQVVFTFAIYATAKSQSYFPMEVHFAVQYEGGFELSRPHSEFVFPEELYSMAIPMVKQIKGMSKEEYDKQYGPTIEYPQSEVDAVYNKLMLTPDGDLEDPWKLNLLFKEHPYLSAEANEYVRNRLEQINSATIGKTWKNPATPIAGRLVLDLDNYRYNEKTGFYHRYDEKKYTDDSEEGYGFGYGPIVYADISVSVRTNVLDEAFINIEYRGNKALTVSSGTENYKLAIEGYSHANYTSIQVLGGGIDCPEEFKGIWGYHEFTNSDGAFPVNKELMTFLQKYAVNQVLFMDGDGWAESSPDYPYESTEEGQWLFACGYYE